LGAIGDNAAVPGVLETLHSEETAVRRMAAYVLGAIGDDRTAKDLRVLLDDKEQDVRWTAAMSLARMKDTGGAEILMQLLDYDYVERLDGLTPEDKATLRVSAVELLTQLKYEPARTKIAELSRSDPSLKVREASIKAVEALNK
jgi:HEAT repeat protein